MQLLKPIFTARAATKTINTGTKSKAYIIMHIYYNPSYCSDDDILITVGNIVKKPRTTAASTKRLDKTFIQFPDKHQRSNRILVQRIPLSLSILLDR